MELGRYRLIAELARGGMGIVHLAEARGPGGFEKLVVVKELKPELSDDPVYTSMFLDEARLAARLSHPHIVQTNEVGCARGRYFMALELLEGGSLHQIRSKLGLRALPLHMGVRVLVAVLDALHHAHELTDDSGSSLGVVHRDVSPQNVFFTFDGEVKLIDFGVAKCRDRRGAASVTRVGVVKGSVPYMSPDHVDGSTIDRRADVFAVGVILREMLLGERLWKDADDLTILRGLIARELPVFPETADVPPRLRAIALRAMAPKRGERFPTAASMRDALESYLADVDVRGSLDDLGAWLGRALADERAAFKDLVKKSRAATPDTLPGARRRPVWLPSTELVTRCSVPQPPPLPVRPSRARTAVSSIAFAAALTLAAFGITHRPQASGTAAESRAPHAVDEDATRTAFVSTVSTAVAHEAESRATSAEIAAEAALAPEPATVSQVPAAVLREALPPNPYDPGE